MTFTSAAECTRGTKPPPNLQPGPCLDRMRPGILLDLGNTEGSPMIAAAL